MRVRLLSPVYLCIYTHSVAFSGQLCTDLKVRTLLITLVLELIQTFQEVIQEQFGQQLSSVLIPTLEAPESRYVLPCLLFLILTPFLIQSSRSCCRRSRQLLRGRQT